MQHAKIASRSVTVAEGQNGGNSCKIKTRNLDYNSLRITEVEQQKNEKMLSGLMSLDFFCNIQMTGARTWCKQHESIDPSCLVSMVLPDISAIIVWEYFLGIHQIPFIPITDHVNTYVLWLTMSLIYDYGSPILRWQIPAGKCTI